MRGLRRRGEGRGEGVLKSKSGVSRTQVYNLIWLL